MVSRQIEGVITNIQGKGPFICIMHDGSQIREFSSQTFFHKGESVKVLLKGEEAEKAEKISDLYGRVESRLESSLKIKKIKKFDKTIDALNPNLEDVCRKLHAAQQLNRFITVKFHGDADGISAALILSKFLKANFMKQGAAVYYVGDAIKDIERMGQEFRPLLVLLDTGSGQDSADAVSLVKSAGIELLSIDHHPIYQNSKQNFSVIVNPWMVSKDEPSNYPAGFLCSRIAAMLGLESGSLENIACAGDKSPIIKVSDEDRNKALVLDFAATYSPFGSGISFYADLLANKPLFDSMLLQANAKLEETSAKLNNMLKSQQTKKAVLYIFNLDAIAERREFPTKGKITGVAFDLVNSNKPTIVIGWGKKSVIFRMNDAAVAKGLGADQIIKHIKSSLVDFIENGGGHARAAALRIKDGYESIALQEIIVYLDR